MTNPKKIFSKLFEKDFYLLKKKNSRFKAIAAKRILTYGQSNQNLTDKISELSLRLGGDTFMSDGMLLWARELGWMNDQDFINSLSLANPQSNELQICWRTHVLCWAAMQAEKVDGNFFESGCYKGLSAFVIRHYCRKIFEEKRNREYYWFDLFIDSDTEKKLKLDHSNSEKIARERGSYFHKVDIIKGNVIDTYLMDTSYNSKTVAFAHFDLNNFEIESKVIEHVMTKVNSRSVLIFDDFGMCPFKRQNTEYRDFFKKFSIPVLELPTGQGVVIIP